MSSPKDNEFIRYAVDMSKMAPAKPTCFRVGAVLVSENQHILATGYTLELGEGWHAEAVAIKKALDKNFRVRGATMYSSLEPCSIRKSGGRDCAALLIESGIKRVVYAMAEPPIFVNCDGTSKLKAAGIEVEKVEELESLVKEVNKHLF